MPSALDSYRRNHQHRRPVRGSGAVALVAALALTGCEAPPDPPAYRNLILVMIDTLRSDHLPSYGYDRDTAPFLTSLAGSGAQFQGYAVSSWTKESVTSLLTGVAPQRHQTISRSDHLATDLPYLPALLRDAGFVTACFVGNLNVGRRWGFDRGFTHYTQTRPAGKATAAEVNTAALRLAPELTSPFFLYLHYVDPHDPYRPSRTWSGKGRPYVQPRPLLASGGITEDDVHRLIDQYDGEIRDLDRALETLLHELDTSGLLKDTLLVVTADHGEEFLEHGRLTHGRSLFEEVLRVPLVFWSQEGLPVMRSAAPFYHLDLLPTILDALALPLPDELEGESQWRHLFAGEEPSRRLPLFFHLDLDRRGGVAVRDGKRKLIHRVQAPHTLLFDLDSDPRETSPLSAAGPQAEGLFGLLLRHHNREGELAVERRIGTVDPGLRRGLAALGYLQLDTPEQELQLRVVPDRLDPRIGLSDTP